MLFPSAIKYALVASVLLPVFASAQVEPVASSTATPSQTTAPQGKVGFVDIELVIEQSKAISMAMDSMDQVMAGKARAIDAKEREFRRNRFEADRQDRVLSSDERERKRLELIKQQEEIEKLKFEFDSELRIRERQIEPVLEYVMRIVADVADEEGFDVVMRGEVIIYGRKSADLTPSVIAKLDSNVAEVIKLFKDAKPATDSSEAPTPTSDSNAPATYAPSFSSPSNNIRETPGVQPIQEVPAQTPEPVLPLVPQ